MDKNDYNREQLLNEILRETSGSKQRRTMPTRTPTPTQPEEPAPKTAPATSKSSLKEQEAEMAAYEAEFAQMAYHEPEEEQTEPAPEYEQEPAYASASSATSATEIQRSSTYSRNYHVNDSLYDDLEGDSQPFHPEPASHNRTGSKPRKHRREHRVISALVMIIVILAVSITLSSLMIVYGRDLLGINSDSSVKIVTIPDGATVKEIAEILQEEEIISKPGFFVTIAGMSDKDKEIKPGDHELRPDMAYETILSELISDPMDSALSVTLTFPEGIRLVDAADLLEENNVCEADEFLDYFNEDATFGYAYESYLPSFQDEKFYRMEGYLFPDTYTFYQEMDVELVAQKILSNFNSKITQEYYDRMDALNISLDQTITLASMIQAEAGSTDQMPTIASVFWNRLNNATEFPLLQSDPTTKYVEEVIKPHSTSYNQSMYDSYDTYTCTGLPSGPICNPGEDAIYAALYPENTDYYYFYANVDTKETFYARTLEEHYANQEKVAEEQEAAAAAEAEAAEENVDDDTEE